MAESVAVQLMADRVVLARVAEAGPELAELTVQPLAEDERPEDAAARMIRERRIENFGLAALVGWDQYHIRDIWLPFTSESQVRSTIKYELEDDFDVGADDLLVPFQILEQRPDASHVLAWILHKQALRDLLNQWSGSAISPEYMPPDAVGHIGLVSALAPELSENPVVAVSGDETSVHLTLIQGRAIWARRRLLGYAWATDAAGRPLQELRRTFLNVPSFPKPAGVVSFGPEAADTLAGVIAREVGVPHNRIPLPVAGDGQRLLYWPLAAGVALLTARHPERPLSFRLEEFEPRQTSEVVSLLSVVATALAGVIFLVGGFMFQLGAQNAARESDVMESYAQAYWEREFPNAKARPTQPPLLSLAASLTKRVDEKRKELKIAQARPDAVKRFSSFADRMGRLPGAMAIQVEPSRVSIGAEGINFLGKVNSYNAATALNKHMDDSADLISEIGNITTDPAGEARFTMKITYEDEVKP